MASLPHTSAAPPATVPRSALLWVGVPALALFLAGAAVLLASGTGAFFQGFDDAVHHWFLATRTPWLTTVNTVLDFVGNTGMVIYAVALLLGLLFWPGKPVLRGSGRHACREDVFHRRRLALFTAGANLGVLALTQLAKLAVGRERPLDRLVSVDSGAYPSGHVSATVAAMLATAFVFARLWIWVAGAVLSAAMVASRLYLGVHWFSDTMGGALLAIGFTCVLWAAMQNKCLGPHISGG